MTNLKSLLNTLPAKKWKVKIDVQHIGYTEYRICWGNLTKKITIEQVEHNTNDVRMHDLPKNWFLP